MAISGCLKYFSDKGYRVLVIDGHEAGTNIASAITKWSQPSGKQAVFVINDYNDPLDIPGNIQVFRTGLYKSHNRINEYVLPVTGVRDFKLTPLPPSIQPRVSFCGCTGTFAKRAEWVQLLQKSDKLHCNFILRGSFADKAANSPEQSVVEFMENMRSSEFVFCPRGYW